MDNRNTGFPWGSDANLDILFCLSITERQGFSTLHVLNAIIFKTWRLLGRHWGNINGRDVLLKVTLLDLRALGSSVNVPAPTPQASTQPAPSTFCIGIVCPFSAGLIGKVLLFPFSRWVH